MKNNSELSGLFNYKNPINGTLEECSLLRLKGMISLSIVSVYIKGQAKGKLAIEIFR